MYEREAKLEKYDRQGRAEEKKAVHLKSDIMESKIYRHRNQKPKRT
jgi:hypothetical protein